MKLLTEPEFIKLTQSTETKQKLQPPPETTQEILSPEYHGIRSISAADLEKYKSGLTGSPYSVTLADGEVVHKQKMVFPQEKHRVKLSNLTRT